MQQRWELVWQRLPDPPKTVGCCQLGDSSLWLWPRITDSESLSGGLAGVRRSGTSCFQDCAAPVRCGGKGVAGKASGAKRLEWHRMAKPSPQQPSDAWATKTAGLPPVESPFPNRKRLKEAPERDCLGTMTSARTVTLVHYQVERKRPWESHSSCRSHSEGVGVLRVGRHLPFPPPNRLPDLINIR